MNSLLILALILFGFTSFYFGKSRIKKVTAKGDLRPKALPHFYGYYQALWCALPAFLIIAIWTVFEPIILKNLIENKIQISSLNEISQDELNLIYSQIISFSQGNFSGQVTKGIEAGAITYKNLLSISQGAKVSLFFCTIIAASLFAFRQINKNVHAREGVEKTLTIILFLSSVAAILTTIGIIFSLLFETIQFFTKINPLDFFLV